MGDAMKHEELLLHLIYAFPGLDDDELSSLSGVQPRQQVNQVCRHLANCGKIIREKGPNGKLVNNLADVRTN